MPHWTQALVRHDWKLCAFISYSWRRSLQVARDTQSLKAPWNFRAGRDTAAPQSRRDKLFFARTGHGDCQTQNTTVSSTEIA